MDVTLRRNDADGKDCSFCGARLAIDESIVHDERSGASLHVACSYFR